MMWAIQMCSDCDSPESQVPGTSIPIGQVPPGDFPDFSELAYTGFPFLIVGLLAGLLIATGVWLAFRYRDRKEAEVDG